MQTQHRVAPSGARSRAHCGAQRGALWLRKLPGLVCWGHQHLPPVLRPRSDSSRSHSRLRENASAGSHRGGVRTQETGTQVLKEETASTETLWKWAPRLMVGLAVLVIALEVVPRASALSGEIVGWRADASRTASVETLAERRMQLRAERASLQGQLAERSAQATTSGDVLGQLDALATQTSVRLTRVEPGVPLSEGAQERIPLAVELVGRFHSVGSYVAGLERSAFQVRRLVLTRSTDSNTLRRIDILNATLALETVRSHTRGRDE